MAQPRTVMREREVAVVEEGVAELQAEKAFFPDERFPMVFYNPIIPDERFYIEGDGYPRRFVDGKFVATNAREEEGVRAALAVHGRGKVDSWIGDDRRNEWHCKKCSFRTFNTQAQDDHEVIRQH